MTFNEGDVVTLKIGSVMMTVEKLRDDDLVATVWFDANGMIHRDCFDKLALQRWQAA